ncbi:MULTISPECIES: aminotransferase-like domain-containing protein [unclassified Streptomyces]|uniref:aminotransferase-like domain-containing protein n=1 Tax=unclassified Streptomyces TaxID=2593676 RepID=UPI0022B6D7FE|nr:MULTISPECIES: PLP-dependent aminotransferase family protein [unclassified Streptomyces]MCZ7413368.1 PLP-dependent aminotransferase family protein [Streptomyces sp. WMMC897]MCZ7430360.1 PLP-dependent aminotransferase family protein [Streptomyces sp. WMMC1477]
MNQSSSVAELARSLRSELNRYSTGERLPSSRVLVDRFRVSPVTVSRALAQLVAEGLVVTRPGAGAFRAAPAEAEALAGQRGDTSWQEVSLSAESAADQVPRTVDATGLLTTLSPLGTGVIGLHGGYLPAALQPERALSAALARAGRRPDAWRLPPLGGVAELRSWFAREIAGPGGARTADEVIVTAGGQSAITTALRALAPPGAPVLVESPTYPGLLAVARASGLRPVPVPADADGVRADLLADAFRATGARVFVCQPLFQNPTGAVLAPERRSAVLSAARAAGAFIVEDDYARRLAHEDAGEPPPTLAAEDSDGIVVHLCSLTKVTSPNLRVGAIAARGPVLERLRAIQIVDSFFVPRPLQEAALELVGAPAWPRHLRAVAAELRARRGALLSALAAELPELVPSHVPRGGFQLWLRLPPSADESAVTANALRAGVAVAPGRPYFAAEPPAPHLRLSFASAAGPAELAEGVHRLRAAVPAPAG